MSLCVGVDVGGTNTDAVVLSLKEVLCSAKVPTTVDVTSGVTGAIKSALDKLPTQFQPSPAQYIARVNIGTTHFVNAVVQRKGLARVAVLRLCGPATVSIPPLCDFPTDLRQVIGGLYFFLNGGYQYDCSVITEIDEEEVKAVAKKVEEAGVNNIVIVGVFSPASGDQEKKVASIVNSVCPGISITLSHEVGLLGLLERENASVLNESLKPLCQRTVAAFRRALRNLGMSCPFYLTQNDGTIVSAKQTLHLPVMTFASGPTNSMRGAAFLSGVQDAIVIDIGGTTSDVGVLKGGFPRQASTRVKIGGVNTNFRMPDVLSIGLGGGSIVRPSEDGVIVGPVSVGYELTEKALVFGGEVMTATDIAVACGLCNIGDKQRLEHLPQNIKTRCMEQIKKRIEAAVDQVKISGESQSVILVGGGSILVNTQTSEPLKGATKVYCPPHYEVANAVGAALSKVSGTFDHVVSMENTTREQARSDAMKEASARAVKAHANPETLEVIDVMEVPLSYLPGNAVRYYLRVVGDLDESTGECAQENEEMQELGDQLETDHQPEDSTPQKQPSFDEEKLFAFKEPYIDPVSGEWILSEYDIECISIGAGILGCGGGGNPYLGKLKTQQAIRSGKKIRVMHPDRLGTTPDLTGTVGITAIMGAPAIIIERLFSGRESSTALKAALAIISNGDAVKHREAEEGVMEAEGIEELMLLKTQAQVLSSKKLVAVMPAEIGGINSVEPLETGAQLGLPIVDADGMGRAFPELQMFLPFVYGSPPYPAAVSDEKGNVATATFTETPKHLETFFRKKTLEMGCMAGLSFLLDWKEVNEKCVKYSLSRVWHLGNNVLRAKQNNESAVDSIIQHEGGKLLATGKILDVSRVTEGAFNKGSLAIEGSGRFYGVIVGIDFQNENYVAYESKSDGSKSILSTVPDLISLVDEDTGEPITTEEVRYGLRVAVIAMPCFPLWTTPKALATVGPAIFGYTDVGYTPIGLYKKHPPFPQL